MFLATHIMLPERYLNVIYTGKRKLAKKYIDYFVKIAHFILQLLGKYGRI